MTAATRTAIEGAAESELHVAAWTGKVGAIQKLIRGGADVNWADSIGETALFGAAAWGKTSAAKVLLEAGAKVNVSEHSLGYTPLHWAASHGGAEMVSILIDAGADPHAEDLQGHRPIDLAIKYRRLKSVTLLRAAMGEPLIAYEIWNRAVWHVADTPAAKGDLALSALLKIHNMVMNGGLSHAIDVRSEVELRAGIDGYKYFDLENLASVLERALSADEEELERLDLEYGMLVPTDDVLFQAFVAVLERFPESFLKL